MAFSDFNLSQGEIDTYIKELDLKDDRTLKVLTYIQLLTTDLFFNILYLLINNKISITQLYNVPINNLSIKGLIDNYNDNPTTYVEYKEFYKNKLNTYPGFVKLVSDANNVSMQLISKEKIISKHFAKEIFIDSLAIDKNKFKNATDVKSLYNIIVNKNNDEDLFLADFYIVDALPESALPIEKMNWLEEKLVPADSSYQVYTLQHANILNSTLSVFINGMIQPPKLYHVTKNKLIFVIPLNEELIVTANYVSLSLLFASSDIGALPNNELDANILVNANDELDANILEEVDSFAYDSNIDVAAITEYDSNIGNNVNSDLDSNDVSGTESDLNLDANSIIVGNTNIDTIAITTFNKAKYGDVILPLSPTLYLFSPIKLDLLRDTYSDLSITVDGITRDYTVYQQFIKLSNGSANVDSLINISYIKDNVYSTETFYRYDMTNRFKLNKSVDMIKMSSLKIFLNGALQTENTDNREDYSIESNVVVFNSNVSITAADEVTSTYFYYNTTITTNSLLENFNKITSSRVLDHTDGRLYRLTKPGEILDLSQGIAVYVNGMSYPNTSYSLFNDYIEFTQSVPNWSNEDIVMVDFSYSVDITEFGKVGLKYLHNYVLSAVGDYKLLYGDFFGNNINLTSNSSFAGFCFRELYNYVPYINLHANISFMLDEMAKDYTHDTTKSLSSDRIKYGIKSINRLIDEYPWVRLSTTKTEAEFLNMLTKIYFLRISIPKIYGNVYFSRSFINKQIGTFYVIQNMSSLCRDYLNVILKRIRKYLLPSNVGVITNVN